MKTAVREDSESDGYLSYADGQWISMFGLHKPLTSRQTVLIIPDRM